MAEGNVCASDEAWSHLQERQGLVSALDLTRTNSNLDSGPVDTAAIIRSFQYSNTIDVIHPLVHSFCLYIPFTEYIDFILQKFDTIIYSTSLYNSVRLVHFLQANSIHLTCSFVSFNWCHFISTVYSSLVIISVDANGHVISSHWVIHNFSAFICPIHPVPSSPSSLANPLVDTSLRSFPSMPSIGCMSLIFINFLWELAQILRDKRFSVSSSNLLVDFRASLWRMSPASRSIKANRIMKHSQQDPTGITDCHNTI